ncbi:haloacid dehalogenase [Candidatus Thorarchaeota archaeon]|nr:MAG: haloacid dehalogenase [Candidatus Thorarchaeota archaeon]
MDLADQLDQLRKEIEHDDRVRENVIPMAREATRKCSEAVKEIHRGNYEGAEEFIKEAHSVLKKAEEKCDESDFISKNKYLDTGYQELTEAANLLSILKDGKYTPGSEYGVLTRSYLTGLGDTIGELRRATLDALRREEVNRAEEILGFMEDILEELSGFDFPDSLIPGLRRKTDVGRRIIEKTRGDVTNAVQQQRLMEQLKEFGSKL